MRLFKEVFPPVRSIGLIKQGDKDMTKRIFAVLLSLIVLLTLPNCLAENALGYVWTDDITPVPYQLKWDELKNLYWDELTPNEQYTCWAMSDLLGYMNQEDSEAVFLAIDSIDSIERLRAFIGNGVIDFSTPFEHDEAILEKVKDFLISTGRELPDGICIYHYIPADGNPEHEQWWVQYGHIRYIEEFGERLTDIVQEGQILYRGPDCSVVNFQEGKDAWVWY